MRLGLSTVAMTAYNTICIRRAPMDVGELVRTIDFIGPKPEEQVRQGLEELVQRGRLAKTGDLYRVLDPKYRLVRTRDTSDADPVTMAGGWEGWLVQCRDRGMMTIEEAIAQGRA